eukprot:1207737-Amphidinium_carterae.2
MHVPSSRSFAKLGLGNGVRKGTWCTSRSPLLCVRTRHRSTSPPHEHKMRPQEDVALKTATLDVKHAGKLALELFTRLPQRSLGSTTLMLNIHVRS